MKILYLCSKHTHDTKMSRIRFQSMTAVGKLCDLKWSGIGWDGYDNDKTVQENIDYLYGDSPPDIVVAYKPLDLKAFNEIKPVKCMRYNEMWNKEWTLEEILGSGTQVVICHHENDMKEYVKLNEVDHVKFYHVPHCAEASIYKDYGEEKVNDVLFTGVVSTHYPFRKKLRSVVRRRLNKIVKCRILNHPGRGGVPYNEIRGHTLEKYAREINRSKISLTCSSKYKYRLGKYIEIPMCHSLLAGDLPDEDQDFFKKFMLVLEPSWSSNQIVDKIVHYVKNDKERNIMIQKGVELNRENTQEKYAKNFLIAIEAALV